MMTEVTEPQSLDAQRAWRLAYEQKRADIDIAYWAEVRDLRDKMGAASRRHDSALDAA